MLGLPQEAAESVRKVRQLVEDLHHAPSRAYALGMQSFFFHAKDDVEEVQRLATEMRALASLEGFALWVSVADIFLAWVSARQGGDAAAALAAYRD